MSNANTPVRTASGVELAATELYALLRLRVEVFVVEQDCAYLELDGLDLLASTRHIWTSDSDGSITGCLRILTESGGTARIGRVCTAARARGRGLGTELMHAALDQIGNADSVLAAQTYARGFYARFGYTAVGAVFEEDGIPHVTMRRAPPR